MNSIFLIGMPGGVEWIVIIIVGLIPLVAIVDIMNSNFRESYMKWVWCALVIFFPFLGPLLYFWFGRDQRVIAKRS